MRLKLAGLALFAAAFGFVEAAIVVYLRTIYQPLRSSVYPGANPGELFPLIRLEQIAPAYLPLLKVELCRELATLLMLAGAALCVARNPRQWLAAFAFCFGVWDIVFYASLKAMLGWPTSLYTWDILFLLPVPWAGPVLAPLLVSAAMILAGTALLAREWRGGDVHIGPMHWLLVVVGGLVVIWSFVIDATNLRSGGWPAPFRWSIFGAGMAIGAAGFIHGWRRSASPPPRQAVGTAASGELSPGERKAQ